VHKYCDWSESEHRDPRPTLCHTSFKVYLWHSMLQAGQHFLTNQ